MVWLMGSLGAGALLLGFLASLGALGEAGLFTRLRRWIVALSFLLAGGLCLGLSVTLRSFRAFAYATTVAEVRCRWVGERTFDLTYQELVDGRSAKPLTVRLRGNQWAISGGVVKWHPWLTALGLPSYHKPTRLSGRYANLEEERAAPSTAVELHGGFDRTWEWFYRAAPLLPFVDAAYGSAAFVYVNPAVVFEVAVTPSGYLIERRRKRSDQ